jgi:hypothetical protein
MLRPELGRGQPEDSRESELLREKTATLRRKALVSAEAALACAPSGASALCCSAAPRCGGSLGRRRVRRSFFWAALQINVHRHSSSVPRLLHQLQTISLAFFLWEQA